ncbi:MAG: Rrf2 family transcriptional regulator [Candidatus Tritonobacter lacicola]|nr:Rrf2 family transcriptional regulator [Candidatus Tritonobacter lacicola]
MGINRDTDYAVRALLCMAKLSAKTGASIIPVKTIVKREKLPRVFLRRLLQELARKKILKSQKGKGGGFSFRKPPETISIDEVMTLFQGPMDLTNCVLGGKACPRRSYCKLRRRLKAMSENIRQELREITIAGLV